MNVKLGGSNAKLDRTLCLPAAMQKKPFMLMGADVHHPPPSDETSPSIAAVVGSYDVHATLFNTVISPQVSLAFDQPLN